MESGKHAYQAKLDARVQFRNIDEKKRLKFIKQCEELYDQIEHPNKLLGTLLTKEERQLLFESYGLPKEIPKQFHNYYVRISYNSVPDTPFSEKFKIINEAYKKLPLAKKNELVKQHQSVSLKFL